MRSTRASARAYVGPLLFTLALAASVEAQTSRRDKLPNIGIDNFGHVNDNYYRGAQPAGRDYADLAALGVKTVVDLTEDGDVNEPGIVQSRGMKFFRIPMTTHAQPAPQAVAQFLKLVNDPANQPVYVHCQGGRHRTGIMTAVYRMVKDGWTAIRRTGRCSTTASGLRSFSPRSRISSTTTTRNSIDRTSCVDPMSLTRKPPLASLGVSSRSG